MIYILTKSYCNALAISVSLNSHIYYSATSGKIGAKKDVL